MYSCHTSKNLPSFLTALSHTAFALVALSFALPKFAAALAWYLYKVRNPMSQVG
jgi:hypothetical protein